MNERFEHLLGLLGYDLIPTDERADMLKNLSVSGLAWLIKHTDNDGWEDETTDIELSRLVDYLTPRIIVCANNEHVRNSLLCGGDIEHDERRELADAWIEAAMDAALGVDFDLVVADDFRDWNGGKYYCSPLIHARNNRSGILSRPDLTAIVDGIRAKADAALAAGMKSITRISPGLLAAAHECIQSLAAELRDKLGSTPEQADAIIVKALKDGVNGGLLSAAVMRAAKEIDQ